MKRKLVLFDIDGTLLLSQGAGRRAILAAMAELHPGHRALDEVRFDGKTDPQIVEELLVAGEIPGSQRAEVIQAVITRYLELLAAELAREGHRTDVMPGIVPLLEALEGEASVVLGLLTGNVRTGATLKLQSAAIAPDRFVVGAFGCDHASRPMLPPIAAQRAEPHFGRIPAGADVVIIGDTPADVACGAGIGARAIAVATGGFTHEELRATGPYAAFHTLEDTGQVCEAILC